MSMQSPNKCTPKQIRGGCHNMNKSGSWSCVQQRGSSGSPYGIPCSVEPFMMAGGSSPHKDLVKEWWFWLAIVGGLVIVALIVMFLMKKKGKGRRA